MRSGLFCDTGLFVQVSTSSAAGGRSPPVMSSNLCPENSSKSTSFVRSSASIKRHARRSSRSACRSCSNDALTILSRDEIQWCPRTAPMQIPGRRDEMGFLECHQRSSFAHTPPCHQRRKSAPPAIACPELTLRSFFRMQHRFDSVNFRYSRGLSSISVMEN